MMPPMIPLLFFLGGGVLSTKAQPQAYQLGQALPLAATCAPIYPARFTIWRQFGGERKGQRMWARSGVQLTTHLSIGIRETGNESTTTHRAGLG